jgi:hypothetical protein
MIHRGREIKRFLEFDIVETRIGSDVPGRAYNSMNRLRNPGVPDYCTVIFAGGLCRVPTFTTTF